jgi:rhamnulokinase
MTLLAFDLGATSGRTSLGDFDGQRLITREIDRFSNIPIRRDERIEWDFPVLLKNVVRGFYRAVQPGESRPEQFAIVSWGLDFGFVGREGTVLQNPRHYRDPGAIRGIHLVEQRVSRECLYLRTGIQHMRFNSIFHLVDTLQDEVNPLPIGARLLQIPDLLLSQLTGETANEYTNATTTQLIDINRQNWDLDLFDRLGIHRSLVESVTYPPANAGALLPDFGVPPINGAIVAGHDTASAVVAIPASGPFAFLSCGTWSLLGTETDHPILDEQVYNWNFSNEGGVLGKNRLLKNIMGLWLVEECRREWKREGFRVDHDSLFQQIVEAQDTGTLIDPDASEFVVPESMPTAIADWANQTNQRVPNSMGEILHVIYASLALKYRLVLQRIEKLTGTRFEALHIVGGGSNNALLCQYTANALGRPVLAGPAEATTYGNLLMQLVHLGRLSSLSEAREVMRQSVNVTRYEPESNTLWTERFERFVEILSQSTHLTDVRSDDHID